MLKKIKALEPGELNNYIAVFGLVAVSGFPFFYKSIFNVIAILLFVVFIFFARGLQFNAKSLAVMGVFFIVEILQSFFIYPIEISTLMGTYIRFFACFLVITICDKKYTRYYVNVIYYLTIIGFIFYFPSIVSNNFRDFFVNTVCPHFPPIGSGDVDFSFYEATPTIMIYTFHPVLEEFRNSGPFWEPGAYSVFLIMALVFNIIHTHTLLSKKNIVFAIAVLSTLSTTGFTALFIVVASFYVVNGDLSKKMFILALFLPVVVYLFFSLDFLGSKIEKNMELKDDNSSRFGSAASDLNDFSTSPLIGWGKGAMRFGGKEFSFFSDDQHRNNGLSDLLASNGIFVFLVLLYNYYKSLKTLCLANSFNKNFAILSFIVFLILGFSQSIFQYPFFLGIMFIHFMYKNEDIAEMAVKKT